MGLFSKDSFKIENGVCWVSFATKGVLQRKAVSKMLDKPKVKECADVRVSISKAVSTIGENAFGGYSNITSIIIEEGVDSISNLAFANCKNLQSITIPKTVKQIGISAFSGCHSLTSVDLPDGINKIEHNLFKDCRALREVILPDSLKGILPLSFANCQALTNINLPKDVTLIDEMAFKGCTSLCEIKFSEELKSIGKGAFCGCSALKKATLPEGLEGIGEGAFSDCSALESIIIPASVTTIENEVFSACPVLKIFCRAEYEPDTWSSGWNCDGCYVCWDYSSRGKSINEDQEISIQIDSNGCFISFNINGKLTKEQADSVFNLEKVKRCSKVYVKIGADEIEENAFYGKEKLVSLEICEGATKIGKNAFGNCSSLAMAKIPESIEVFSRDAFYGCDSLKYYEKNSLYYMGNDENNCVALAGVKDKHIEECAVDSSTKFILDNAFEGCNALKSVFLPETVKRMGNGIFSGCEKLQRVNIPGGIAKIGENMFFGCKSLKNITIPESVVVIGGGAFEGCQDLESFSFPDNVVKIGIRAFFGCKALREITFPQHLVELEELVMCDCHSLFTAELPESLLTIKRGAFSGCKSLSYVVLPNELETIDSEAFRGCDGLGEIEISENVRVMGENAFDVSEDVDIYCEAKKQPNNWSRNWYGSQNRPIWGYGSSVVLDLEDARCKITFNIEGSLGAKLVSDVFRTRRVKRCTHIGIKIGANVVGIGEKAFSGYTYLKEIELSGGLKEIGKKAFENCTGLKEIEIPKKVNFIEEEAFLGCDGLEFYCEAVKKPAGWSFIGENSSAVWGYGKELFIEEQGETCIVRFDGRDFLARETTNNALLCKKVKSFKNVAVKIGNSITSIDANAFSDIENLSRVEIGKNVSKLGADFTSKGKRLEYIGVDEENQHFKSVNGVLYTKDGAILLKCPSVTNRAVFVPEGVSEISRGAFSGCTSLRSISLPSTLRKIGDEAFNECVSLEGIEIPQGVDTIGENAFAKCNSLKSIDIPDSSSSYIKSLLEECPNVERVVLPYHISEIDVMWFKGCKNIKAVEISPFNKTYKTINGCIYSKDGEALLMYPRGKEDSSFVVPLEVKKIAPFTFEGCRSLKEVKISENVEVIEKRAFGNASNIFVSIINKNENYRTVNGVIYTKDGKTLVQYIPLDGKTKYEVLDGVETIGESAFENCENLKSVTMPFSTRVIDNRAFWGCKALEDITMPEKVQRIGESAFAHCVSLTKLVIPRGVKEINEGAFYGCESLRLYCKARKAMDGWSALHAPVEEWGYGSPKDFEGYTIDVKGRDCTIYFDVDGELSSYLVSNAFKDAERKGAKNITVEMSDWIKSIGEHAFSYKESLSKVIVGEAVTRIGERAFCSCKSLTSVVIPEGVNHIGESAFYSCKSLTNIVIPEGVTYIGEHAFEGCKSLTSVVIPEGVTYIGEYAFDGCESLTNIVIPHSVKKIGSNSFYGCKSLTSVVIPEGVTEIGEGAFYGCNHLKNISIPRSVKKIAREAFFGCDKLNCVFIPKAVKDIGFWAFGSDYGNTKLLFEAGNEKGNYFLYEEKVVLNCKINGLNELSCDDAVYVKDGEYVTVRILGSGELDRYKAKKILGLIEDDKKIIVQFCPDITSIGNNAFAGDKRIVKVELTSNIKSIDRYSFSGCVKLEEISIPEGVESIGWGVFYGCKSLKIVKLPSTVNDIRDDWFGYCSSLKSIEVSPLSNSFKSIDGNLYSKDGKKLIQYAVGKKDKEFILPESVEKIGSYAFDSASFLKKLYMGVNVENVWAIRAVNSLEELVLDPQNNHLKLVDGMLYTKDAKTLIRSFSGMTNRVCVVLDGVETISRGAFSGCDRVEKVVLPNGVKKIEKEAFSGCKSLASINIPKGVNEIEFGAFYGCESLSKIHVPKSVRLMRDCVFEKCNSLTIYCEAKEKPLFWNKSWNHLNRPVIWACEPSTN